ncbi:ankyrin repeats (3 copies) domain-containing protein [Purpureocillium lilacinum]|uniref:Ankyrin repeats (3 copies) domain-containing protein n=1 Tax=Purpureocillium lilacinum TaxID=33203 RepID=A0A179HJD5_PURLI|nr:ankyrin repeats (3 copies) domain-containing protein [Purpureocillium lilacinum]OAQ89748.1 ankyrin repeats (3 copies) domain-containing protein [Purpureocillium lilacinum]
MASSDEKYRSIFDSTSLLVFFATPHRSTKHQGWDGIALGLLHQCYCGLISPWIATFPPNFAEAMTNLEVEFRAPARAFILNVCQDPGPASPVKDSVVIHKLSAALGLDGECHIGLDCSHYNLGRFLQARGKRYLQNQMSYAAFRHGKVLQQVLGFFSLGKIRTFDVEDPTLKYWKVASQFALLPEVQSWREDSTDSRVLWVATPPMLDPTSLFSTLRSQIQQEDQFRPPVFIRVDATLYRHDELSEAQILSNMCAQMLRQQPQLASALQDLLLNVQDAAVGDHKLWQQRALWSCLRVLLYCPKDADTFCFIDATSSSHTKALAAELGPLLEASEMGLRLMVACRSARGQTPNVLTKYNVDLADEDFHEPLRQDLEEWIRESLESGNTPLTLAASRGFYDIVGCLLKHSKGQPWTKGYWVDVNAQNQQKYNALLAAARYGFSQTLETLLACEGIDYSKTDGASAGILHLALANNRATTASRILDRKDMFSNETESREASRAASPVNEDDDDSFSESSNDTTQVVLNAAPRPKISLRQKDRSGHTPLVIAIRRNLKFIVRSLVEMGAEINYFPEEPNAPLLAAAEVGSLELVTMLTGMGAKLDMDTTGFTTPLHVACTMGYLDVARELLKGSADQLSQRDGTQRTPFGAAITRGQSHIIDFLIDLQTREGLWEGLWAAAISGKAHIVDRLLRDGAKIDAQDSYGNTALQGAAYYDYPRCVERLILRGARLGLVDCDDINALGDAARAGSAESLELLVNAGVNVDAETGGETALCRAIWAEEAECVDVLLQGGAKLVLSSTLAEHETVLNFAVEHSTPEIVRLLLEESEGEGLAKALKIALQTDSTSQLEVLMEFYDPAKVDLGSGRTILHLAAEGSLAGLAKVLEHATGRAALNSGPKKVGTPLEIAACSLKSSLDKVKYLHNEAALVGVVQPAGRFGTPLNAASYSRNVPVVEYLIQQMQQEDINASGTHYGNAIQNTLADAWKDVDLSIRLLDILLEAGVPTTPASTDRHGTALHTAALYGPKTLVEKILKINRALADEGDGLGQLPIHLSAFQGDWESMMLLTTSTSTIRSVDKMGRNAVHLAAAAGACLVLEEVFATNENMDLLLAPDLDGWTPLHWACRSVDDDGVRFLIEKAQEAFGPAWDIMTDDLLTKDEKRWTPLDVARFHQRTELELLLSLGMTTSDAESWEPDRSRHLGSDCDSCSCSIWHEGYHCMHDDCFDFDLCFKCINYKDEIHPVDHEFVRTGKRFKYSDEPLWRFESIDD